MPDGGYDIRSAAAGGQPDYGVLRGKCEVFEDPDCCLTVVFGSLDSLYGSVRPTRDHRLHPFESHAEESHAEESHAEESHAEGGGHSADYRVVSGLICPGFIDLQINGAFGIDVSPDENGLRELAAKLPQTGTTSFLPTAISWPGERYETFLEALGKASSVRGFRILGAHIEGPFLSPERKGAHDPKNLHEVDLGLLKDILGAGPVSVMTVAPELEDAEKAAGLLREGGAVASIGHTNATYEEILHAIDAGFSKATHLYNAMSSFEHRAPGAMGAVLTDDRVRAGIIADGVHVHEGALRLAYREKSVEGLALVTDAMEAAGMDDGEYELSGRTVRLEGGYVRLPDGTLAGSSLTMDGAVQNAVKFLGIPL